MPYASDGVAPPNSNPAVPTVAAGTVGGPTPVAIAAPTLPRGTVVFVDTTRIVVDLTAKDGVRAGATVSVRRDKIPIVHPVTGELLGELDEEVATGKVTEVRDKFSVIEVQNIAPGAEIKVKDRVLVR
jgi:hypothetical protein